MATETKNFQIIQKTGADDYLIVHPETSDDNVLVSAEGIEADNLKGALGELASKIDDAVAGGVTSVNGQTGAVTVDKTTLGLDEVDNTSDEDKPVSTAQKAALDLKADKTELELKADKSYVDEELEKKADASDIPDVTSFITKAVDDLVNYYTKSDIDGKVEDLEGKISAIPKFKISVVSQLPDSGEEATIYLVSNGGSESQNLYVEYIWTGSAYEKLGEQKLDLSGYATTDALNTAIKDFLKESDVNELIETALADYIKASDVSAIGKSGKLADAEGDETHRLVTDSEKSDWNNAKTTAESAKGVADEAKETADSNATEITNIKNGTTKVGAATQADSATVAESADKLSAPKTISLTGDVEGSVSFDGSADAPMTVNLIDSGVKPGSYSAVTVDVKGRVTAGAQLIEIGSDNQSTPSANLAIGGLFFKKI